MEQINNYIIEKLKINSKSKIHKINAFDYLIDSLLNTIFLNYHLTEDSFETNNGLSQPKEFPKHFDYYSDFIDELNYHKEWYDIFPYHNDIASVRIKEEDEDDDTCILFQFERSIKKIKYINLSENIKNALLNETNK